MAQIKLDDKKLQENFSQKVASLNLNEDQKKEIKQKIEETIKEVKGSPLDTDVWIYRMIVSFLGVVILMTVWGIIFKYNENGAGIPETLTAIGSGALGALAGLLAPSPRQQ